MGETPIFLSAPFCSVKHRVRLWSQGLEDADGEQMERFLFTLDLEDVCGCTLGNKAEC